ncbi:hypothetical protein [uncultured Pseudacidovorax sp.]|uniref:hypothetical protein n=1 Tax=uncultured Pseudacidovorax sp. TaxID=679313 RepID=UPI0026001349|nr:hypothetical protein [uncultured Pseudacidovorax sp.]
MTRIGLTGVLMAASLLAACDDRRPAEGAAASRPSAAAAPASVPVPAPAPSPAPADAALVAPSGQGDRIAPPVVPPVSRNGVRYAQAADGRSLGWSQVGGVLEAIDEASGKRLWSLPVYRQAADSQREADVQWVFFRSMRLQPDGTLLIENEDGEQYQVDVEQRSSTRRRTP